MFDACSDRIGRSEVMGGGEAGLSDDLLLQICGITQAEVEELPGTLDDLRSLSGLVQRSSTRRACLEAAVTLLAAVLGRVPRNNPVHLPFGYEGPQVHSHNWVDKEAVACVGKQLVGLIRHDAEPESVAFNVEFALAESLRLGFLDQKRYDGWRPGMPSGSGWRTAVTATPYGVMKSRAMQESAVQPGLRKNSVASPACPPESAANDVHHAQPACATPAQPDEHVGVDLYAFARQADIVKATNDVLGEGELNKGVLSRACQMRKIETNGKPGAASRVRVSSFLVWAGRQFSLGNAEQVQIRNAIIGEIAARNSQGSTLA